MKQILNLVWILSFIFLKTEGQEYIPLLKDNNKWNYLAIANTTCCTSSYAVHTFFTNDEVVINGKVQKQLFNRINHFPDTEEIQIGYIYEDIVNKKVTFTNMQNDEVVLFNFGATKGEIIRSKVVDNFGVKIHTYTVIKDIGTYEYDGEDRLKYGVEDYKKVTFKDGRTTLNLIGEYHWYEGIGRKDYILATEMVESVYKVELLCFYQDGELKYKDNILPCNPSKFYLIENGLITRVGNEHLVNKPIVSVDHVLKKIVVNNVEKINQMKLININGIKVQDVFDCNEININSLTSGIYILVICTDNNKIHTNKLQIF